jgi:hypothetical protein
MMGVPELIHVPVTVVGAGVGVGVGAGVGVGDGVGVVVAVAGGVVVVGAVGDEDPPPQAAAMTAKNTRGAIRIRNIMSYGRTVIRFSRQPSGRIPGLRSFR